MGDLNAEFTPKITREEFESRNRHVFGDYITLPCICGDDLCEGWASVPPMLWDIKRQMNDFVEQAHEIFQRPDEAEK